MRGTNLLGNWQGRRKTYSNNRRTLKGTQTLLLRQANEGLLPFLHNIAEA
jgi:hypothetical protein